ncbi:unnamed protein product, partial [Effrenium voratum]
KCKGEINLPEFKAVMLASLRSLVPKEWNSQHEVAWNWLWENVERLLTKQLGKPRAQQKALERFVVNLSQDALTGYCRDVYKRFFQLAPSGQDFFKQSTTRLFFIAEKIVEMTVEMYRTPKKMVEELSGLGLRHVGYGVPTELFSPYVTAAVEIVRGFTTDDTTETAFAWSLTLIAKIMVRTLVEGSTVVMQAINTNIEKNLKKAIAVAPRGKRAMELLNITVGTQSISPLYWAIESGSLVCAQAMIEDLLTIRADRDNYYYGADALFTRHPEVIKKLSSSAPSLLETLLEGLVWRSRVISNGTRRVNCYCKHLMQDVDGNPHQALQWLVEYGNPVIISQFTIVLVADLIWTRLAAYHFLLGRCYFLFTLCVAVTSQSFLSYSKASKTPETLESNTVVFVCRIFLYLGSMGKILYGQIRCFQADCRNGDIDRSFYIPIPQYLFSLKEAGNFLLLWILVCMCIEEPLWHCGVWSTTETALIFSTHCETIEENGSKRRYTGFSCVAILLYWALLLDFSIFSMHISAYVLVFGRVLSEVALFVMALAFVVVAFATSIMALEHDFVEMASMDEWLLSLTEMSLGMFHPDYYRSLNSESNVLIVVIIFMLIVSIILVNLLVAQLNQAYQHVYTDMQGYARLNRASVIVATLEGISNKRWGRFLRGMNFEERLEFNEGDVGLAGGVQIVEPAAAHIVTVDSIRRFGGSSAPTMPWPDEEDSMEDRFDRLEKLIVSSVKKMGKGRSKKKKTKVLRICWVVTDKYDIQVLRLKEESRTVQAQLSKASAELGSLKEKNAQLARSDFSATSMAMDGMTDDYLTARLGKMYMVPSNEVMTSSEAAEKHLRAFEQGCEEWMSYHAQPIAEEELEGYESFVLALLTGPDFKNEKEYETRIQAVRREFKTTLSKPQIVRAYYRLRESGRIPRNASFEKITTKKSVRSNSGVVVITVVTAPGRFSCPNDCFYCPDEPGQPRSYLSTEPAVARANQNEFDPVRQFYDRAGTLAKQGHTVDKVEIIVLGGTWSHYPRDYQEEWCRDLFYAANTFDEQLSKLGEKGEKAARVRPRRSLLEEQKLNEVAVTKIIGLTLETRPDHITPAEVRRLRRYGCTRVQIGVQHTNDDILIHINRGHDRAAAVRATRLLKICGFKVDLHLMPDLPGSDPEKDWVMFEDVLFGEDLQADHWKIYPCEVTPFTRIETWYKEGKFMPYTEKDPRLLTELLARVKAQVHPWIRLNRVIRDIPEVSIVAGNSLTNLRQAIFEVLKSRGQCCRCIRCREVRDWPETADGLRLRVREYRSSGGREFFISIEGGHRGFGGGATQRALAGGQKATKKEKNQRKAPYRDANAQKEMKAAALAAGGSREERKKAAEAAVQKLREAEAEKKVEEEQPAADDDNATLYGLLRLRFNDDDKAPGPIFPELSGCALIRELHVYGTLVAAGRAEGDRAEDDERPQHIGIGKTLMGTAELIAAAHGYRRISVIAGVGVRNYYRRLGYVLRGDGQYLIKELKPCQESHSASSFEASFVEAALRVQQRASRWRPGRTATVLGLLTLVGVCFMTLVTMVRLSPLDALTMSTEQDRVHFKKAEAERRKEIEILRQEHDRLRKEHTVQLEALKARLVQEDTRRQKRAFLSHTTVQSPSPPPSSSHRHTHTVMEVNLLDEGNPYMEEKLEETSSEYSAEDPREAGERPWAPASFGR